MQYSHYEIDPNKCVGCSICLQNCPISAISGDAGKAHKIDQDICIKCGTCFQVCPYKAIKRS